MDKIDKRPPAKVAFMATPGAGKAVSEAWTALVGWVRSNGWDDVFWRTLLGLIVYTFTQNDMQEINDKFYLRTSTIMMDAWECVSEFMARIKGGRTALKPICSRGECGG